MRYRELWRIFLFFVNKVSKKIEFIRAVIPRKITNFVCSHYTPKHMYAVLAMKNIMIKI